MTDQNRVDKLAAAANTAEVILLSYIKFRGKTAKPYIFVVEGNDDVTFVQTATAIINSTIFSHISFFNCRGKQNALDLISLIRESKQLSISSVWFFIDRDFDGLRGRQADTQLWVTPTYAFENLLVSRQVLEALLVAEYRCHGPEGDEEVSKICDLFDELILSYREKMKTPNLCLFHCVRNSIPTHSIDDLIASRISLVSGALKLDADDVFFYEGVPKLSSLSVLDLEKTYVDFHKLDPVKDWRGKFLLRIFVDFLVHLKMDRGSKNPKLFMRRAKMTFSPLNDAIRALTVLATLPDCLKTFLCSVPTPRN
ncbi:MULTISPECIES: DUF4435 domain-containing protein [Roseomonadaceae]|uniref:DUF4435 domain-containing protein n=1 Tax=Falsiroseomonas oleicola TaxID=2801474 RepID=A0ABS6HG94_9PROT|nr:DUF4435 domain-containing protein [Roseomonas oleicola]MBU8546310.1 DUF4435 domain-containing protein [Roseomonas oleicola]